MHLLINTSLKQFVYITKLPLESYRIALLAYFDLFFSSVNDLIEATINIDVKTDVKTICKTISLSFISLFSLR